MGTLGGVEPSAPEVISRTADLLDSPPYDDPFYADNPDDDLQGVARIKQRPPEGEWFVWLLMAGRGFGKTRCATAWLNQMVRERCTDGQQVLIAGRTPADVRTFTLKGPGGLLTHYSDIEYFPSRREVVWPNGVVGIIRSGANPEEFRGFSGDYAVLEELAAWQYPEDAWSNLSLGMRESDPRITIATTPRPIKTLKEIKEMPGTVTISGTSFENRDNLAASYITNVLDPLSKTRLGRQEVFAELLEDVPGALWRLETDPKTGLPGINDGRVYPNQVPDLERIVVGVDPQGTKGEGSATGIVVAGISGGGHIYVLADMTINGSPSEWATRVIAAVDKYRADRVVSERNFGGDMVESTIRNVRAGVPYKNVSASHGKYQRAEPVAALYEVGRVHHVGVFAALEDEQCTFVPGVKQSPNRMDALVWAIFDLAGKGGMHGFLTGSATDEEIDEMDREIARLEEELGIQ